MTTTTFAASYAATRAKLGRSARTSVVALLGRAAARAAYAAGSARRALFTVGGFALIAYAAWEVAQPLGLVTAGVSLLLLDYLTGDSQ